MKKKRDKKEKDKVEILDEVQTADNNEPEAFPEEQSEAEKLSEMTDRYQRSLAEFDNFRKRTAKELSTRYDDGVRAACEKLLPIVDNFERALAAHDNKEDKFFAGVEMIARQLEGVLGEMGVTPIQTETGAVFDTALHYAVAHVEDAELGENAIADVLQKGYMHKERVIRPVMVKVAN